MKLVKRNGEYYLDLPLDKSKIYTITVGRENTLLVFEENGLEEFAKKFEDDEENESIIGRKYCILLMKKAVQSSYQANYGFSIPLALLNTDRKEFQFRRIRDKPGLVGVVELV